MLPAQLVEYGIEALHMGVRGHAAVRAARVRDIPVHVPLDVADRQRPQQGVDPGVDLGAHVVAAEVEDQLVAEGQLRRRGGGQNPVRMSPEQVASALAERVETARNNGTLAGSVVGQNVLNVRRDIWALVDVHPIRAMAAGHALHYEITVVPIQTNQNTGDDEDSKENTNVGSHSGREVLAAVRERAKVLLKDGERAGALELAETLLQRHLAHISTESGDDEDTNQSGVPAADNTAPDEDTTTTKRLAGALKES